MSAPGTTAATAQVPPCESAWSDESREAFMATHYWYYFVAPPGTFEPYAGMHIALLGERVVDADRDFGTLARRLDADPARFPLDRMLFRYIPTVEEAIQYRY